MLQVAGYVPAIQEKLRKQGFPRFSHSLVQTLILPLGSTVPEAPWDAQYHFASTDKRREVVLSSNFITYQVTTYDTFERWVDEWSEILTVVHSELDIALVERSGLRYVDVVVAEEPDAVEMSLQPGLRGLDGLGLRGVQSRFELRGASEIGSLVFRASRPQSGAIPEDLQPIELDVPQVAGLQTGTYVVLDFDHFSTIARDFDPPALVQHFWALHDLVDSAFRHSVTDDALRRWQA